MASQDHTIDLAGFQRLAVEANPQKAGVFWDSPHREDWARLSESLDQDFLPVGSRLDTGSTPGFLLAWVDQAARRFVLACTDGQVRLGEVGPGGPAWLGPSLRMAGYDESRDEVLTVFRAAPLFARHSEVLVVVRSWPVGGLEPTVRLYRALVHAPEKDAVSLVAGQDGTRAGDPLDWRALDLTPDRVPPWLQACTLVVPTGYDLPRRPPPDLERTRLDIPDKAGEPRIAVWTGERVLWACANDALVLGSRADDWAHIPAFPLGLAVEASPYGSLRLLVAGHDRRLYGLEVQDARVGSGPRSTLGAQPLCVTAFPGPSLAWPDALVATREGAIQLLRYVGRDEIRRVWVCGVGADAPAGGVFPTLLDGAIAKVRAPDLWTQDLPRTEVQALARGLLDLVEASPALAPGRIMAVADAFAGSHFSPAWPWLGREIGARLARAARELPLPSHDEAGRRLSALLSVAERLVDVCPVEVREQVGLRLAVAPVPRPRAGAYATTHRDALPRLQTRAGMSRWAILESPNAAPALRNEVLADFASKEYLLESHWTERQFQGRGVAELGPPDKPVMVVMGRRDLRLLELADGELVPQSARAVALPDGAVLRHVRAFELTPGGGRWAVVGTQSGRAYLLDAAGCAEELAAGPVQAACRASVFVGRTGAGAARLALLWVQDLRSFVEVLDIDPVDGGQRRVRRVWYAPLPAPYVSDADTLPGPDANSLRLVLGDARLRQVLVVQLEPDKKEIREVARLAVESPVTALRCESVDGTARILAGTREGLVWCFRQPDGQVLWSFRAKESVRSLDLRAATGHQFGECAVTAGPGDVVVLDATGRRTWRGTFSRTARAARFLGGGPGRPERLAVASIDGTLSILRRPDPAESWAAMLEESMRTHQAGGGSALAGRDRRTAELQRAFSAKSPAEAPELLESFVFRRACRVLSCRLVALEGWTQEQRRAIAAAATCRELGHMARAIPEGQFRFWVEPLLDQVFQRQAPPGDRGDNSRVARNSACAQVFLRLANEREPLPGEDLEAWLRRVPADVQEDRWVQIEAARAWLASCGGPRADDEDSRSRVVARLPAIPPGLARGLAWVARPAALADALAGLANLAVESDKAATPSDSGLREVAQRLAPFGLGQGMLAHLRRVLVLAIDPPPKPEDRWTSLLELVSGFRSLSPEVVDPLGVLKPESFGSRDSQLPVDSWPLSQQVRWLRDRLGESLYLGDPAQPGLTGWQRTVRDLARRLNEVAREILRERLARLEGLTRPYLRVDRVGRPTPGRVQLDLVLVPEGTRTLEDVRIDVQPADESSLRALDRPLRRSFARAQWCAGEPAEALRLDAYVDPQTQLVRLRVDTHSRNQPDHAMHWNVPLPSPAVAHASGRLPFPAGVPTAFRRVLGEIRASKSGIVLVAMDDVLNPASLVDTLVADDDARALDLDAALRELGPGRRYPNALTSGAVVHCLNGQDPLHETSPLPDSDRLFRTNAPFRRLVVYPLQETVTRLLLAEFTSRRADFDRRLLRHGHERRSPALVLVLPSALAARLRRRLGSAASTVFAGRLAGATEAGDGAPGPKTEAGLEWREAVEWVRKCLAVDDGDARQIVSESHGDLRTVATRVQRARPAPEDTTAQNDPRADPGHFTLLDLGALNASEVLHLAVCAGADALVSPSDLKPGMVVGENVLSKPRATGVVPKILAECGDALTRSDIISKIRSRQPPLRTVRIRGIRPDKPFVLGENREPLYKTLGHLSSAALDSLCAKGFCRREQGLYRVEPLCEQAVEQVFGSTAGAAEAFERLTGGRGLLDGIELGRLASVSDELASLLVGLRGRERAEIVRVVGRVWSLAAGAAGPSSADCENLARALSGLAATDQRQAPPGLVRLAEVFQREHGVVVGIDTQSKPGDCRAYLGVGTGKQPPDFGSLAAALESLSAGDRPDGRPSMAICGPSVARWPLPPETRGIVMLSDDAIRRILRAPDMPRAFWAALHAQLGVARTSPFVVSGALGPGSPLFVGRRVILDEIRAHLADRNFLILGARRIGKTSLLHQVRRFVEENPRFVGHYFDCQGVGSGAALQPKVAAALAAAGIEVSVQTDADQRLRLLSTAARRRGAVPVFFLNEIDGLLAHDLPFLERLRGLSEENDGARLVMVGYHLVAESLDDSRSPFFHWTTGRLSEKAFNLAELSDEEALELVDRLESPPLSLSWDSAQERERGRHLILDLSYRIPWVIQQICARLVRLLDEERRINLRADDLRRVTVSDRPVLRELERTDFASLVGRPPGEPVTNLLARALVLAMTNDLYFHDRPAAANPRIQDESPAFHAFTSAEARETLDRQIRGLFGREERTRVQAALGAFPIDRLLRNLCLTLYLAPVEGSSGGGEPRFCFRNHIYPLELSAVARHGKSVGEHLVETLANLSAALYLPGVPA